MTLQIGDQLPTLEEYNRARHLARDGRIYEHNKVNIISGNVIAYDECCNTAGREFCWPIIRQEETLECSTLVGDIRFKLVCPFTDCDGKPVPVTFRLGAADDRGFVIDPEFFVADGDFDLTTVNFALKPETGKFTTKPVIVLAQVETAPGIEAPVAGELHWFIDIRTTSQDEQYPT